MPPKMLTSCPHELRAGITVCYHCRHDARVAAAARRGALLKKGAIALIGVGVIAGVSIPGIRLLRGNQVQSAAAKKSESVSLSEVSNAKPSAATPLVEVNHTPAQPPEKTATLSTVIADSAVALMSGASAMRSGDTVIVDFDTQMLRTRRAAKFEEIIRSSLSEIFGSPVEAALTNMPRGSIVVAEDIFADLPERGIHIRIDAASTISLWPKVRTREDGPLVVGYRAVVNSE